MIAKEIFLSIVIPFYNTASNELKNCIDSLQAIRVPTEILIIDDGSDESYRISGQEYTLSDKRIRWVEKENGGVSSARNIGIQHARGKYLCFVDSDDQIGIEFINYVNEHYEQLSDDWILFDIYVNDIKKQKQYKRKLFPRYMERADISLEEVLSLRVKGKELSECWGKLILRELVVNHQIQFPIGVLTGEDRIFNTRLLYVTKKISYVPCVAYCYNYIPRIGTRILQNPKKRYEFLSLEKKELKELLEKRMDSSTKDKLLSIANRTWIISIVQDSFIFAKSGSLDKKMRKLLAQWVKEERILDNSNIADFDGVKKKIYYLLLKYRMWPVMNLIGRCKKG